MFYCEICDLHMSDANKGSHLRGKKHNSLALRNTAKRKFRRENGQSQDLLQKKMKMLTTANDLDQQAGSSVTLVDIHPENVELRTENNLTEMEKVVGLRNYFAPKVHLKKKESTPTVVNLENLYSLPQYGLLGSTMDESQEHVFMNTNDPFVLVSCGVQNAGKSHTTNVVLENCLIGVAGPDEGQADIVKLAKPMAALVMHYDQAQSVVCESTGLVQTSSNIRHFLRNPISLPKTIVLVSPTYYEQRKAFYGPGGNYIVKPLLFKWSTLTAAHIRQLMRIEEKENQLYMNLLTSKLREYQRIGVFPRYEAFVREMTQNLMDRQSAPLLQRLDVMSQFIADADVNSVLRKEQSDLSDLIGSGVLVVADLTDPMLRAEEANAIFQVLLEQFRMKVLDCGKIVVCDEAHKYFGSVQGNLTGLAKAITTTARMMRHEGIRLVISTQSPLTCPPELFELSCLCVLHSCHSQDWYDYLKKKLPLPYDGFEILTNLDAGQALLFAAKKALGNEHESSVVSIKIRPRITQDRGASIQNVDEYDLHTGPMIHSGESESTLDRDASVESFAPDDIVLVPTVEKPSEHASESSDNI